MDKQVLLIDQIGLLSRLYRFADFVYIGGGFGQGIHNILEPLAYCKPVAFGPKFHKFKEAEIAIEFAYGFEINEAGELVAIATKMTDSELKRHKQSIQEYLDQNRDASEKYFNICKPKNGYLYAERANSSNSRASYRSQSHRHWRYHDR